MALSDSDDPGYLDWNMECCNWEQKYNDKLDALESQFKSLVKQLYSDEALDLGKLDETICDMAQEFDIPAHKLPMSQAKIERRKTEIYKFATELAQVQKVR